MIMKDIIKSKRLALGLSQENLAKQLGVKRITVTQWEAGRNTPKTKMLQEIAKALKCSTDDLLKQEPVQANKKKAPMRRKAGIQSLKHGSSHRMPG